MPWVCDAMLCSYVAYYRCECTLTIVHHIAIYMLFCKYDEALHSTHTLHIPDSVAIKPNPLAVIKIKSSRADSALFYLYSVCMCVCIVHAEQRNRERESKRESKPKHLVVTFFSISCNETQRLIDRHTHTHTVAHHNSICFACRHVRRQWKKQCMAIPVAVII